MIKKGLFIVVDGPSASGKDTVVRQVLKDLKSLNVEAISIQETKEKKYDREKILSAKQHGDQEVAETIIEERKKLYRTRVIPQLTVGTLVIVNRGEPATLAYQTIKNEITMGNIWNMHRQQQIPLPDLVVITNCSVREAGRRENLRETPSEEKNKNLMSGKFTSARKRVHANYKIVKDFLEKKGLAVIYLKTDTMNMSETSQKIVNFIKIR